MTKRMKSSPRIIPIFKPARMNSNHVVGYLKKNLPQDYGKIGHFGTLDPFACGVLMIGISGASKLNDYIHKYCPKTYLAIGKLGVHTETGDLTSDITKKDETSYFKNEISKLTKNFLQETLHQKFVGEYLQAPHKYSAAKFQGRPLHEWARAGVEIVKEEKTRTIYNLEVVKFSFPYLILRVEVSSGTYVRTLFKDVAEYIGTHGTLVSLVRESVGSISINQCLKKKDWPKDRHLQPVKTYLEIEEVLKLNSLCLTSDEEKTYRNGKRFPVENSRIEELKIAPHTSQYLWVKNLREEILGMGEIVEGELRAQFNFALS